MLVILEEEGKIEIYGNRCQRGDRIGRSKVEAMEDQILRSKIKVRGRMRKVPVQSHKPVPGEHLNELRKRLEQTVLTPPIQKGDIVLEDILGIGITFFATKEIR